MERFSRLEGGPVVSELGGAQISTLLESLPGIANVLRSPVADALVSVIRAGARLSEFDIADADELVKYATRRGLLAEDEGERLMLDLQAAHQKKLDRIAARPAKPAKGKNGKGAGSRPKPKAKAAKPKPKAHKKATAKKKH
jgi:hypothetical protein